VGAHRTRGCKRAWGVPGAPELVEALAELGELDEAQGVTDRLCELAEWQEHPWELATVKRCGAALRLA
jgi:hypothetical protein